MNYFELFEFEIAAIIDKSLLTKKYLQLQKQYHPDNFSLSDENEQNQSLEMSSLINKAFAVFKDDLKTIGYFLEIKGLISDEEKYQLPSTFLMEMMEVNEQIDEGGFEASSIEPIQHELDQEIQFVIQKNASDYTDDELLRVKEFYYKKKYLKRILDRLTD
ncbi:MAG: Fe-S protein assembly co-chaperone HscB [Sphingobacteriales bacterium]|nr:Fe-S protein assembly co-chaperone HscB [Sphingobacteriales bacterium]